jgi:hypothetical protein
MPPTILVDLGLKALRQTRLGRVIRRVAGRARRAGTAAGTGLRPFPWLVRMAFTDPAAVLAEGAFHG